MIAKLRFRFSGTSYNWWFSAYNFLRVSFRWIRVTFFRRSTDSKILIFQSDRKNTIWTLPTIRRFGLYDFLSVVFLRKCSTIFWRSSDSEKSIFQSDRKNLISIFMNSPIYRDSEYTVLFFTFHYESQKFGFEKYQKTLHPTPKRPKWTTKTLLPTFSERFPAYKTAHFLKNSRKPKFDGFGFRWSQVKKNAPFLTSWNPFLQSSKIRFPYECTGHKNRVFQKFFFGSWFKIVFLSLIDGNF